MHQAGLEYVWTHQTNLEFGWTHQAWTEYDHTYQSNLSWKLTGPVMTGVSAKVTWWLWAACMVPCLGLSWVGLELEQYTDPGFNEWTGESDCAPSPMMANSLDLSFSCPSPSYASTQDSLDWDSGLVLDISVTQFWWFGSLCLDMSVRHTYRVQENIFWLVSWIFGLNVAGRARNLNVPIFTTFYSKLVREGWWCRNLIVEPS